MVYLTRWVSLPPHGSTYIMFHGIDYGWFPALLKVWHCHPFWNWFFHFPLTSITLTCDCFYYGSIMTVHLSATSRRFGIWQFVSHPQFPSGYPLAIFLFWRVVTLTLIAYHSYSIWQFSGVFSLVPPFHRHYLVLKSHVDSFLFSLLLVKVAW